MLKKQLAILLTVCLMPIAALGEECPLYIRHVENLPEDFILGMDVSSVLSLPQHSKADSRMLPAHLLRSL